MLTSNKIIILGYSGHSYSIIEDLLFNEIRIKGYLDIEEKENNIFNLKYLGKEEEFNHKNKEFDFLITIGNNKIRSNIFNFLVNSHSNLPNFIHSSVNFPNKILIGRGNQILSSCIINPNTQIGVNNILNSGSIIEHDCRIGNNCHIGPGSVICGNVNIGNNTFVGANTVIIEGVNIGNNVFIGAGSVIIRDVDDNSKVVGNPARLIK